MQLGKKYANFSFIQCMFEKKTLLKVSRHRHGWKIANELKVKRPKKKLFFNLKLSEKTMFQAFISLYVAGVNF